VIINDDVLVSYLADGKARWHGSEPTKAISNLRVLKKTSQSE
jgi:hypothetical protein